MFKSLTVCAWQAQRKALVGDLNQVLEALEKLKTPLGPPPASQ